MSCFLDLCGDRLDVRDQYQIHVFAQTPSALFRLFWISLQPQREFLSFGSFEISPSETSVGGLVTTKRSRHVTLHGFSHFHVKNDKSKTLFEAIRGLPEVEQEERLLRFISSPLAEVQLKDVGQKAVKELIVDAPDQNCSVGMMASFVPKNREHDASDVIIGWGQALLRVHFGIGNPHNSAFPGLGLVARHGEPSQKIKHVRIG